MKIILFVLIIAITIFFNSCTLHNTDNIEVADNNITLLVDRPSIGVVGRNQCDWPNLNAALEDLYSQFKYHNPFATKYDSYNINVRLRVRQRDKYGEEYYEYEDSYLLVTVSGDEIEKYKSVKYMDKGLELSSKISFIVEQTTTTYHLSF